MNSPLRISALPLPLLRSGKVREVYAVGESQLLIVASDRVSAFDVVMAEAVPDKGRVLTQLSAFWFSMLGSVTPSHFLTADTAEILRDLPELASHRAQIAGRAMLVRRTEPVLFECVVRGYLAGSAWGEYRRSGTLAGEPLPRGLAESDRLDPPIFSPATKAESGHDENVAYDRMRTATGCLARRGDCERSHSRSTRPVAAYAAERGLIIADTKFEFGIGPDGTPILIDEVLTPDSSRFWPADPVPAWPEPAQFRQAAAA